MASEGIEWDALAYHRSPSALATAYDIFAGTLFVRRKIRERKFDVLQGGYMATLMGALARKFSGRKPKLIFDIRGFFPRIHRCGRLA
ncbi:MAG: hypothetical protein IPJ55_17520 [Chloracidobacterium sp.]|nr:hypothetical protein [Chloracidobacterium sp.]